MLVLPSNRDLDLEDSSPMEAEEVMVARITATVVLGKARVHLTTLAANNPGMVYKETAFEALKVVGTITTTLCSLVTLEMLMSARLMRF